MGKLLREASLSAPARHSQHLLRLAAACESVIPLLGKICRRIEMEVAQMSSPPNHENVVSERNLD